MVKNEMVQKEIYPYKMFKCLNLKFKTMKIVQFISYLIRRYFSEFQLSLISSIQKIDVEKS